MPLNVISNLNNSTFLLISTGKGTSPLTWRHPKMLIQPQLGRQVNTHNSVVAKFFTKISNMELLAQHSDVLCKQYKHWHMFDIDIALSPAQIREEQHSCHITHQEPSCPLAPPCKAKLPLQKSTLYFQKCLGALYLHSEAESEELWDQILENPNLNWERVSWLIRVVGGKKLYQFFCIQKLILEEIECVEMQPTLKHCQLCWFLYSSLLRSSGGTFRWPFQSY